jgi:hypothetical protein
VQTGPINSQARPIQGAPLAPPAAAEPPPPKLIEVDLQQIYCPHYLVDEDGAVTPNSAEIKKNVNPGLVRLHKEDAQRVLGLQIALPTRNTWADL